jgi:hypothetical protein
MSVWVWIVIGAVLLLAFSLLVGLVIARVLGSIAREVSPLLEAEAEAEAWATAPLAYAARERVVIASEEVVSLSQTVRSPDKEFAARGDPAPDRVRRPLGAAPSDPSPTVSAAPAGARRRPRRSQAPGRRPNPQHLRR